MRGCRQAREFLSEDGKGYSTPGTPTEVKRGRKNLSLPSSTMNQPLKRARNSDPTADGQQDDDYYGKSLLSLQGPQLLLQSCMLASVPCHSFRSILPGSQIDFIGASAGLKSQTFRPRSKSDGVRIVSGRGDFDFPAWRPHDDKPLEQKLCLKIRFGSNLLLQSG